MLNNGKGILFSPAEEWRVERKKKTHKLNQKYNSLDEYDPEARREVLREILGELNENVLEASKMISSWGSLVLLAAILLSSFIGALIGRKVVKKHLLSESA